MVDYYNKYLKYKRKYFDLYFKSNNSIKSNNKLRNNSINQNGGLININNIYLLCDTINKKFKVNLMEHNNIYKINGNRIAIISDKEIDKLIDKYNDDIFGKKTNLYSFCCINSLINIYKIQKMLIISYDNIIPFIASICNEINIDYYDKNYDKNNNYNKLREISIIDKVNKEYDCILTSNKEILNMNELINNLKEEGYLFSINKEQKIKITNNSYELLNEGVIMNNNDLIYIYRKVNKKGKINRDVYDKELIIKQIEFEKKKLNIIREDKLIGGTKQRIGIDILKKIKENNIFYRGPINGYAQVALSYSCLLLNKKFHVILDKQKNNKKYIITLLAMIFGAIVHEVDKINIKDKDKRKEAEYKRLDNIVDKYKPFGGSYLIPLGLKGSENIELYMNTKIKELSKLPIKRIWLVAASGVIYHALHSLLPNTKFNVVFVSVKNYKIIKDRTNVYEAQQYHYDPTNLPPPYPSEISYDAKIWQFVKKYGENEDYIFNVAGLNIYN